MADEAHAPETADDFAQFATESGVLEWLRDSAPGEAVPETPVDTGGAAEQPRDDKGRFMPQNVEEEQPEQPEAEQAEEPEAEVQPEEPEADEDEQLVLEIDDELQAVLDRYNGDVGKALKALSESQSMIGRQANEVGELRNELAQMREMMQQGFQQQQQPQYFGPYQNDLDNPKGLVAEALERGDQQTLEVAIRAWGEEEPFEAAAFLFSLSAQSAQNLQPEYEPTPQQSVGPAENIEAAMAAVVQRHPDVEQYLPQLEGVAQEFPTLRNFMQQGTPAQKAQAFEELLVITKSRSQSATSRDAIKRVVLKTQEEVRKEKADASVVSAQTQTAATAKEDRLADFYRAFEEATGQVEDKDWIQRDHWIHRT